jgi:RNA polymerase sigma-70 factor (ECF subfamily)
LRKKDLFLRAIYFNRYNLKNEKTIYDSSELELIEKIRSGDRNSFQVMFLKYYPKLYRFALRYIPESSIAEDIVQDLFADLWKNHFKLKIDYSLSSYLYAATRNRALNYIKRNPNVKNVEEEELLLVVDAENDPEREFINKELSDIVNKAIEKLPGRCKLIFNMNRKDGLKYGEIAKILEISENTVTTQIARAFKKLRELLSSFEYK